MLQLSSDKGRLRKTLFVNRNAPSRQFVTGLTKRRAETGPLSAPPPPPQAPAVAN